MTLYDKVVCFRDIIKDIWTVKNDDPIRTYSIAPFLTIGFVIAAPFVFPYF